MLGYQTLIAEDGDAGNGVQVFGVQEVNELGQVVNINLMLAEQRVFEWNGHASVGILDIENDSIAADLAPVPNDAQSVIAGSHDPGEINGAHFKIPRHGDALFRDRYRQDAGDSDLFASFQDIARSYRLVRRANRLSELGRGEIRGELQIMASHSGNAVAAPGRVKRGG